jgi:inorganic phosphate transporter, PiT family
VFRLSSAQGMTWILWTLVVTSFALTFANGANDNFKGVATLFGSGTASYRRALAWATITTAAGSVTALLLASRLVARFSGKGLVPDALTADPTFLSAVGGGAALTVFLASRLGLPISTTHALTGALVGAGLLAAGTELRLSALGSTFVAPLLMSPFVAAILISAINLVIGVITRRGSASRHAGATSDDRTMDATSGATSGAHAASAASTTSAAPAPVTSRSLDVAHYLSAGAVGFARGVNDTPKLLALLTPVPLISPHGGAALIAVTMAVGGLLGARRVAETISHRVTTMSPHQGFGTNLTTATLVLFASQFGLPVSTTHVSSGALFGLGAVTGQARWNTIIQIVLAWAATLPCAAVLAALLWWIMAS